MRRSKVAGRLVDGPFCYCPAGVRRSQSGCKNIAATTKSQRLRLESKTHILTDVHKIDDQESVCDCDSHYHCCHFTIRAAVP